MEDKKFVFVGTKLDLIKKPDWFENFRAKYDENYEPHITLKHAMVLQGDYSEIIKEVANIVKKYKQFNLVFEKIHTGPTPFGSCIMIEAEYNKELADLQKEIVETVSKYGTPSIKEYEEFEKNFKPHQTIARRLSPDKLEKAMSELGKDTKCAGIIREINLVLSNDDSFVGWSNPINKTIFKLKN